MFRLPELPYSLQALEPQISFRSLKWHYDVLHRNYVDKVNMLVDRSAAGATLIDVAASARRVGDLELYHAAAQAWNHAFFWPSMRPYNGSLGTPEGPLSDMIRRQYGGLAALRESFVQTGVDHFASGWLWVCLGGEHGQEVTVIATPDAENPILEGSGTPLMVCDLWEHSYYLDNGPDRESYLCSWFDVLADFTFASDNARRVFLT